MTADPRPVPAELLDLALATAREAAALVADGRARAADDVQSKTTTVDVVTAVDKASEQLVVDRLLSPARTTACWARRGRRGRAAAGSAGWSTRSTAR